MSSVAVACSEWLYAVTCIMQRALPYQAEHDHYYYEMIPWFGQGWWCELWIVDVDVFPTGAVGRVQTNGFYIHEIY